ncbi:serpin family protein [Sporichthya polymorpha]|uniref:serpin family protein n=1 Tax=Sporichthya polymorpha TaxID=35751 RepID=UPI0003788B08|nr:serpin family protein [Sporichthya polymorpha]
MRRTATTGRGRALALGLAVATALTACGGSGGDDMTSDAVVQVAGATRLAPAADAPVGPVVSGLDAFAAELFHATKAKENLVFSPLSIAYAFAMLRVGANGTSAAELDGAFGLPAGFAAAFNALTQALVTEGPATPPPAPPTGEGNPPPSAPTLQIANGLFTQRGFGYGENFLRTLTEQFGGELRTIDFSATQQAVDAVNAWAAEHTAGRIPRILEELDPQTVLVLLNAVHLDADWATPFREVGNRPFAVAGQNVQVPTMSLETQVAHVEGDGFSAVELPYFGDRLAMRVLLPTGKNTPADLITPRVLAAAAKTKPVRARVTMPRWDFGSDLDLKPLMSILGVRAVFDPTAADLSGISTDRQLFVQQAKHKANITVDELGTVASAVTALGIGVTSVPVDPPVVFTVDRPFAFVIVDTATGAPVFVGQVLDPRAN